jgi:hypothetical protein
MPVGFLYDFAQGIYYKFSILSTGALIETYNSIETFEIGPVAFHVRTTRNTAAQHIYN